LRAWLVATRTITIVLRAPLPQWGEGRVRGVRRVQTRHTYVSYTAYDPYKYRPCGYESQGLP